MSCMVGLQDWVVLGLEEKDDRFTRRDGRLNEAGWDCWLKPLNENVENESLHTAIYKCSLHSRDLYRHQNRETRIQTLVTSADLYRHLSLLYKQEDKLCLSPVTSVSHPWPLSSTLSSHMVSPVTCKMKKNIKTMPRSKRIKIKR